MNIINKSKNLCIVLIFAVLFSILFMMPQESSYAKSSSKPRIEDIEYDAEDREVSIDFYGRVRYKKLKVRIYDSAGKQYARYIISRDSDDIEVYVKRMRFNRTYRIKISGVKKWGRAGKYRTINTTFRTYWDD